MVPEVVHPDVLAALRLFDRLGLECSPAVAEPDNGEYGAAVSDVGRASARFRVGKLTPTKVGLFVTVWRRLPGGSTAPFPAEDNIDLLVVAAREGPHFGQFVFPKAALVEQGIISVDGVGGKRGFRVYPPWSATDNPQARRSQKWQCVFFLELGDGAGVDLARARQLFQLG